MSDTETRRLVTGYVPQLALTGVAIALWGALGLTYWYRFWKHGTRYMLCLCISMTAMVIGYVIRILMTDKPDSLGIYIGTTLLTLLSPCGFIATSYIVLPRLATWLNAEDCLFLPSSKIVRIFVWSDVTTFFLQASGSGLTAMTGTIANVGKYICLIGLGVQLASFSTFCCLLFVWAFRVRKNQSWKWSNIAHYENRTVKLRIFEDWRVIFYALIWSGVGILIRSVFRIAEYAEGYDGKLRTTEIYLYVLDSLPLFLGMLVWAVVWPPAILNQDSPFKSPLGDQLGNQHALAFINRSSETEVGRYNSAEKV